VENTSLDSLLQFGHPTKTRALIKMQVNIGVDLWHFENESAEKYSVVFPYISY
jgi:isocitrate lyase